MVEGQREQDAASIFKTTGPCTAKCGTQQHVVRQDHAFWKTCGARGVDDVACRVNARARNRRQVHVFAECIEECSTLEPRVDIDLARCKNNHIF